MSNFFSTQKNDNKEDPDDSLKYFRAIKSTLKNTQPTSSTQSGSAVKGFINNAADSPPKKVAKKKTPKKAAKKPSTRKKNQPDIRRLLSKEEQMVHNVLEVSCRENNLDPDEVQLALALSESMKETESKETLQKFENPFTTGGKVQSVNTILEKFGFKTGKALSEFEQEILKSGKFSKRSKFQKAPTLLTRTSKEEREELIQSRIIKVIDQKTYSDSNQQLSVDVAIHSPHLQDFYMQINSIASLENSEESCDDVIQKYYVMDLFQPSYIQPDYLLKDWNRIPGRDRSPQKDVKNVDEELMLSEDICDEPLNEKENQAEKSEVLQKLKETEEKLISSLNSSCSDIFADVESFKIDNVAELTHVSQQLDILHERLSKTDIATEVDEEFSNKEDLTMRNQISELSDERKLCPVSESEQKAQDDQNPGNSSNVDLNLNNSVDTELKELENYFKVGNLSKEIHQNTSKIDLILEENQNLETSKGNDQNYENSLKLQSSQVPIEIDLTVGCSDDSSRLTRKSSQMSIKSAFNDSKGSRKSFSATATSMSINNDSDNTIEYEIPPVTSYSVSQALKPESPVKIDSSSDEEIHDLTQEEVPLKIQEYNGAVEEEAYDLTQEEENNSQGNESSKDPQNSQQDFQNDSSQEDPSSEFDVIDISDDEINYSIQAFNDEHFKAESDDIEILEIENLPNSNESSPSKNYEDLNFKNLLNETSEMLQHTSSAPRDSLNQSTKKFFAFENLSDSIQDIIKKYGGKKSESPKKNSFRKYQSESSIKLNDSNKSIVDLTQDENNFMDLSQHEDEVFSQEAILELEKAQTSQVPFDDFNFEPDALQDLENIPELVLESSINQSINNIINSPAISRTRKSLANRRKSRKSLLTLSNEKYEIDAENFIPEIDFKSMTPAELKKELYNYGIRPLPVKKAVELLQHIHDSIYPKIRIAAEEEIDENDSRVDLNHTDIVANIACNGDDDDFVFQYGEVVGEDFIMPKKGKGKVMHKIQLIFQILKFFIVIVI